MPEYSRRTSTVNEYNIGSVRQQKRINKVSKPPKVITTYYNTPGMSGTTFNDIGNSDWSPDNLPSNITIETIEINNVTRNYLKINFNIFDDNILLCFPGGGEDMFTFLNYTNFDAIGSRVIIFKGQNSGNEYTFQNAFPWMYNEIQNDVDFVDTVIKDIINQESFVPKLFLTGKSDGGGFTILYAHASNYKKYIKAIGICSAAHFGINSVNNIGIYNQNTTINNVVIPYNIVLPPAISIFIMHGTGDQVMPYNGQNYKNSSALTLANAEETIWADIDSSLTNTYTANIQSYVNKIINNNTSHLDIINGIYSSQTAITSRSCINFITIFQQNHCWSGHTNSGPDSDYLPNMQLDATYLLALFFKLKMGNYIPTFTTIPYNFKKYDSLQR